MSDQPLLWQPELAGGHGGLRCRAKEALNVAEGLTEMSVQETMLRVSWGQADVPTGSCSGQQCQSEA